MKLITLMLSLLLAISCASKPQSNEHAKTIMAMYSEKIPASVPLAERKLLGISHFSNFSEKYKQEFLLAVEKANTTLKTKCFSDFMLNRKMIMTNGLTNQQVVDVLQSTYQEMGLVSYRKWGSVRGYTTPTSEKIWVNAKFYIGSKSCDKASNLAHEISSHKNGFGHTFYANKQRPFSVPYSVNEAFKVCCK